MYYMKCKPYTGRKRCKQCKRELVQKCCRTGECDAQNGAFCDSGAESASPGKVEIRRRGKVCRTVEKGVPSAELPRLTAKARRC